MTTSSNTADDEMRIRAIVEDWSAALRDKDADRMVAHQGGDFVLYSLAPPLVSQATGAAGLNEWFGTWDGPLEIEHRDLEVQVDGAVAFAYGLTRLAGTKVDGRRNEIWFRHTMGFGKRAGQWRIVHQHESVPFYMDGSYRAAVDLAP